MFFSEDVQVKLSRITAVFLFWQIFKVFAAGLVDAPTSMRHKARKTPFFN
jgi:hypothetical protein